MLEFKYISWIVVVSCLFLNLIGLFWCLLLILSFIAFILGILSILYLQHGDVETFLKNGIAINPLDQPKQLGLNLACDQPILLVLPNIKEQIGSNKLHTKTSTVEHRKKSLIDSGIELLFKKSPKNSQNYHHNHHQTNLNKSNSNSSNDLKFRHQDIILDNSHHDSDRKWKPFETIRIYTDRRKSHDENRKSDVPIGEDCSSLPVIQHLKSETGLMDEHGSPTKKKKTMLSGNKQIDQLLHTFIEYILRDYIDSWFSSLSENKEFSEFRTRNCIEESLQNICNRIKSTPWIPLITTKLVENVATHARLYRLATQTNFTTIGKDCKSQPKMSPHRRMKKEQQLQQQHLHNHRRNKSDTDLSWYLNTSSNHKQVANSKFYTDHEIDEKLLCDPDLKLIKTFFDHSDLFKGECLDEEKLERYLTHVMETCLYYTLPEEDYACLPLRTFLSTLLANVVCKPILEILSDPDFINLQVARLFSKEPPPGEFLIKLMRQCNDVSELRACRQFITTEMDSKFKDASATSELNSLKYTQKLIDLRLSHLLSNKSELSKMDRGDKLISNLPILTLDELLTKELALSYYLDYLSILNLQKYVIFYLTAVEWKMSTTRCMQEFQTNKNKSSRDEFTKNFRERAANIFNEYLLSGSTNCLQIDPGLIEALNIRIRDQNILPDGNWFDSICKFVYEKLKNEDVFLNHFYQSAPYKKLLLELECYGQKDETLLDLDSNSDNVNLNFEIGSDSNSGDLLFEDEGMTIDDREPESESANFLELPGSFKHSRSHSDCTGLVQNLSDINVVALAGAAPSLHTTKLKKSDLNCIVTTSLKVPSTGETASGGSRPTTPVKSPIQNSEPFEIQQKMFAKIINTAIHCEGQYAVYAVQVYIIEDNQQKSWHIYRRYSKFLELKKILVKRYSSMSRIPFPAKKTFQNTERSVLEHRMVMLNEFLKHICLRAEDNDDIYHIIREFMEPDTNDKKIHGGTVIRTIETIVNPIKFGMKTIKNMPDTLVGGISKIFLGKGPMKESSFLDVTPIHLEHSSEYPALTSALNLLDEVFDLQARSQWLRRGIINRLLGAPWVSHAANKRILHAAKTMTDTDKIEHVLNAVLTNLWPDGKRKQKTVPREDNTKLRTKMAAKIALFALLSDDLKHLVGSETTRYGLLNFFSMLQHKKLNLRLVLVILNNILTTIYPTDSMTKHVKE